MSDVRLRDRVRGWFTGAGVRCYVAYYSWRIVRAKHRWRCVRSQGGGVLVTPRPMTQDGALKWFRRVVDAEVIFIDPNIHHIFYRPKVH
ncbi:MAG: hypothetical protein ACREQD_02530 [Candidatus Binataceae bacterium]